MGTITGRFHLNALKTAREVVETRVSVEQLIKDHKTGKNKSRMTSIKIIIISHGNKNWKVSPKLLENCKRSCGDKIVSTDGLTDGRKDGRTKAYSPLRLTSGEYLKFWLFVTLCNCAEIRE